MLKVRVQACHVTSAHDMALHRHVMTSHEPSHALHHVCHNMHTCHTTSYQLHSFYYYDLHTPIPRSEPYAAHLSSPMWHPSTLCGPYLKPYLARALLSLSIYRLITGTPTCGRSTHAPASVNLSRSLPRQLSLPTKISRRSPPTCNQLAPPLAERRGAKINKP